SDGTDPASLPYAYDMLLQTWEKNPSRFLYGAVYSEQGDPERGSAYWLPWNERWTLVLTSYFLNLEQIPTAFSALLLLLNALIMYALARFVSWPRTVASGIAMAWAFCAYTRARAKVHMALVGYYHLPAIFLSLLLVARGRSKRSLTLAAAGFLLSGTVAHF